MTNQQIEKLENKYLNKFYHFLKSFEDEMMDGFATRRARALDGFAARGVSYSRRATTVRIDRYIDRLINE